MTSHWRPTEIQQILTIEPQSQPVQVVTSNSHVSNPVLPNASSANKLHALLGHYNSDESESENDSEFKTFMNEIKESASVPPAQSTSWQELWDPQSGQPYYWNTITNELTWEKPDKMTNPSVIKQESAGAPTVPLEAPTAKALSIANVSTNRIPSTNQSSSNTSACAKQPDTKVELSSRKEESKISFRLVGAEKSTKNGDSLVPKVNGKVWDAASVIAAIEKEMPPDYKQETFVPLFKRRAPDKAKSKLGNDFKSYFRPTGQCVLDFDSESSCRALPAMVPSTHRGLGYEEKVEQTEEEPANAQLQFVAGEVLKPLVPTTPLTLDERIKRLESQQLDACESTLLESSKHKCIAQLEVLKEAWQKKKLDSSFLDEWLTSVEHNLNDDKTRESTTRDQVVDMVLEETDSESEETPKVRSPATASIANNNPLELDSELSSFYNDLASLDAVSQSAAPLTICPSAAKSEETIPSSRTEQNEEESAVIIDHVNKGGKRTKMSSDMTSLVAKWQRRRQENT